MTTGKFITLEGIEGVGKSTVVTLICDWFQSQQIDYILTREPGGTPFAEDIRQILLSRHEELMTPLTEAFLFFAGRNQNVTHKIKPALSKGQWVLSDRFTDSSLAYQGGGRGVPAERLEAMAGWVQDGLVPDITILLDAPVDVALGRIQSREKDRIEDEKAEFFQRIRDRYLALAKQHATRYRIVNADQPLEQVKQDICTVLNSL